MGNLGAELVEQGHQGTQVQFLKIAQQGVDKSGGKRPAERKDEKIKKTTS